MRISDGSSDVCSSDLQTARKAGRETIGLANEMSGYFREMFTKLNISCDAFVRTPEQRQDRKSVGAGKSVAVRVDLGGRQRFNKEPTTTHLIPHTSPLQLTTTPFISTNAPTIKT